MFELHGEELARAARACTLAMYGHVNDDAIAEAIADVFLMLASWSGEDVLSQATVLPKLIDAVERRLRQRYRQEVAVTDVVQPFDEYAIDQLSVRDYSVRTESDRGVRAEVMSSLARLSPRKRRLVELRYLQGLQPHEIAHLLGVTTVSVSNALYTCRQELRRALSVHRSDSSARKPGTRSAVFDQQPVLATALEADDDPSVGKVSRARSQLGLATRKRPSGKVNAKHEPPGTDRA